MIGCANESLTVDRNIDYVIVRYTCVTEDNPDLAICIEATTQGKINILVRPLNNTIPNVDYIHGGSINISEYAVDNIAELAYNKNVLNYKTKKKSNELENQYAEIFEVYNSKGQLIQYIQDAGIIQEDVRALADKLYSFTIHDSDSYTMYIQKISDTYEILK